MCIHTTIHFIPIWRKSELTIAGNPSLLEVFFHEQIDWILYLEDVDMSRCWQDFHSLKQMDNIGHLVRCWGYHHNPSIEKRKKKHVLLSWDNYIYASLRG